MPASASPQVWCSSPNSPDGGARAMTTLLEMPSPPTAVFCYNDMMALGAYHATRGRAKVPQDVSIVGFDDLFFARYLDPPLTTTAQPTRQMGRKAMEIALALVDGKTTERVVHIKGELMVRAHGPAIAGAKERVIFFGHRGCAHTFPLVFTACGPHRHHARGHAASRRVEVHQLCDSSARPSKPWRTTTEGRSVASSC